MDIKDLLVMAASMQTKEEIVERIEDVAKNVRLGIDPEADKELAMLCQMYLINLMTQGDFKKAMELTKEMEQDKSRKDMFNPDKTAN